MAKWTGFLPLLLIIALCGTAIEGKRVKSGNGNEWEELESIIDDMDGSKQPRDVSNKRESDGEAAGTTAPEHNPCEDHMCGWGKECVVDKRGKPVCECISQVRHWASLSLFRQTICALPVPHLRGRRRH